MFWLNHSWAKGSASVLFAAIAFIDITNGPYSDAIADMKSGSGLFIVNLTVVASTTVICLSASLTKRLMTLTGPRAMLRSR